GGEGGGAAAGGGGGGAAATAHGRPAAGPVEAQHLAGAGGRVEDGACQDLCAGGTKAELELGDDAEVPAPAADGPEEVRVVVLAGADAVIACDHPFGE